MLERLRQAAGLIRENRRLTVIMVSTVLVMSGQGVIAPVLPLFARSFGVSAASVGLTLSAFALARLVLNVPLGMASDRYGRRPLLVAGPLVTGLGMIGSGFAGGIPGLLFWRLVAGAGSAMYMTGAQVYLVDISTPQNRARVLGANLGALLFGVSIGPGIGGVLAEAFGFRLPFFVVGAAAIVTSIYGHRRLPETRPPRSLGAPPERGVDPSDPSGRPAWRRLLGSRDFLAVSLLTAMVFLTRAGGRFTVLPLLAAAGFGYDARSIGALFTAMALINLVGLGPAATITDRVGHKTAIVPSGLVTAAALALIARTGSPAVFLGAALLLAVGTSIMGPAPAAYAADVAPREVRGLAMGLYRSAGDLGFVVGPVFLGAIADATTLGGALAANAAIVFAVTLLFAITARERRRDA
jgi:DHA1 family multidrug resistance protein-like MFS transporter